MKLIKMLMMMIMMKEEDKDDDDNFQGKSLGTVQTTLTALWSSSFLSLRTKSRFLQTFLSRPISIKSRSDFHMMMIMTMNLAIFKSQGAKIL